MAILGLDLGKAVGLCFGNFGPEPGQGSGPLLWHWAKLLVSILAVLGLSLGKALGLYFGNLGSESGQGSGLYFGHFGLESG